jgi:hypothetical protein
MAKINDALRLVFWTNILIFGLFSEQANDEQQHNWSSETCANNKYAQTR